MNRLVPAALALVACASGARIDDGLDALVPEALLAPSEDTLDEDDPVAQDTPSAWRECFEAIAGDADGDEPSPDYDPFEPVVGSHCNGTNHQDITGVERVVFLGDSVTVGTPPTPTEDVYRARLAGSLAVEFGLDEPSFLWEQVNPFSGETTLRESGDFASCARWGAETDDLQGQLDDCFPADKRDQATLVIMTVGGNDLNGITGGFADGRPVDDLWDETESFMADMRAAVDWLVAPGRFPNGVYVIFTNLYEFTDATGDVTSCPTAALAGYDTDVNDPALAQMVVWAMDEYMSIAVDDQVDLVFLLENFCGHGYRRDDPNGRCYRGPGAELWFDLTCIHPNPTGHAEIADMFLSVVRE